MNYPMLVAAFTEIRKFHPTVCKVQFLTDQLGPLWTYTDRYGNPPEFSPFLDSSVLEDALCEVEDTIGYPSTFVFENGHVREDVQ